MYIEIKIMMAVVESLESNSREFSWKIIILLRSGKILQKLKCTYWTLEWRLKKIIVMANKNHKH